MATINIPDSMVPEGYELDGVAVNECSWSRECGRFHATVVMRRKPRLKRIVFTVAGEKRIIQSGEWYERELGEVRQAMSFTGGVYYPLTRTEEYE